MPPLCGGNSSSERANVGLSSKIEDHPKQEESIVKKHVIL
jgi:hypothetical protein